MTRGRFSKRREPPKINMDKRCDANRKSKHKMKSLDGTTKQDVEGKALNTTRFYGCRDRKGYV